MLLLASVIVMTCSLVLGGGTHAGFLGDVGLQLIALPVLLISLWQLFSCKSNRQFRLAFLFCTLLLLLPLLQLLPLPPLLWTALPGRQEIVASFLLLGRELPWLPISVSPDATWFAALSLLPPLALFCCVAQISRRDRRILSLTILVVGVVSVFLGLIQISQGPASSLRFFEDTNPNDAVGFFANRNHFSALLYCALPIAAAWTMDAVATASTQPKRKVHRATAIATLIGGFAILVILIAGQVMARSRAGMGFTVIAMFGATALGVSGVRSPRWLSLGRIISAATMLVAIFATQFALYRFLERFAGDPLVNARRVLADNTVEAAQAFMPIGAGLGSFTTVYGLFEEAGDTLSTYANRAHNDVLELWLETGVAGLVLMAAFVIWVLTRAFVVWFRPPPIEDIDISLARAATLIIGLVLAHSLVDYPLRTGAISAILAFACALLLPPMGHSAETRQGSSSTNHIPLSEDWSVSSNTANDGPT